MITEKRKLLLFFVFFLVMGLTGTCLRRLPL